MSPFIDCETFSTCTSCYWDSCCVMKCTDHCNHTFSCKSSTDHHHTAGDIRWCAVENTLTPSSLINITFSSSSVCTICTNKNSTCCGSTNDMVTPINCSTVSTALTPSSQSSAVTPPVNSVSLMGIYLSVTNTHFTTSTTNTAVSSVLATSTFISVIVPAVVGMAALLCLLVAAVFGIIPVLALVLCKTKRKQFPVTNNSDQMSQQRYTIWCMFSQKCFNTF